MFPNRTNGGKKPIKMSVVCGVAGQKNDGGWNVMQYISRTLGVLVLAATIGACSAPMPDSGVDNGVGFGNYAEYERQRLARDNQLTGAAPLNPAAISQETVTTGGETPPQNETGVAVNTDHVRISDEQDFQAVSGRETIESDAERIAANRAQYEVIQPTALPERAGNGGPNIVEFALSTTNQVGQEIHSRSIILAESRFNRNCGQYPSSDLAQEAFLKAGGPERDRMGLDPDGDGFACYWDPTPFRAARRN